jgi:hypothetical protein
MRTTLITLGIVCILAAIVGGGLKALGIELPKLDSKSRQWLLAGFGVVLLIVATLIPNPPSNAQAGSSMAPPPSALSRPHRR